MSSNKGYQNKIKRKTKKVAKKVAKKHPLLAIFLVVVFIGIAVGGYFVYNKYFKKPESNSNGVVAVGDISFHFMMLGNKYAGDSIYIKAGENDILIDAGSRADSSDDIINYVNKYCTDKSLEYVIATHSDRDHIASFGNKDGIFDYYDCKTIIDFPMTNKTIEGEINTVYEKYVSKRDLEVSQSGAKHFTALECYNETNGAKREYVLGDSMSMEILYNYYYDHITSDENDYSVCLLFKHGDKKFLLTGDLEKDGEQKLAEKYKDLGAVELFKAGHHGSYTASNTALLNVIRPKVCVVSCNAGNDEYSKINANMFPSQAFIDRISVYTENVYVTTIADNRYTKDGAEFSALNGNIVVSSSGNENVVVSCDNNTLLKDTQWFKENRTMPSSWIS